MNYMLKRIYLTGFMTSGKSTLGKILANVLGWDFFDLDKEIEDQEGLRITEIFENKGEKYFREIETNKLKELSDKKLIVNLTPERRKEKLFQVTPTGKDVLKNILEMTDKGDK